MSITYEFKAKLFIVLAPDTRMSTFLLRNQVAASYLRSRQTGRGDELLNLEIFDTLLEAKVLIEGWRREYNTIRPHSSLEYVPPASETRQPCCQIPATRPSGNTADPP